MDQLKNDLLDNINKIILDNSIQLRTDLGVQPLFGAVGGSLSLNLANESSDIDVYLAVEDMHDLVSDVGVKRILIKDKKIDFMYMSIRELISECEKYMLKEHIYPTFFSRKQDETNHIRNLKDIERKDFKREMVMRMFLADKMIEFQKDAIIKNYEKLKKGLLLIDIWDAYFCRAYGNYHESIESKEKVSLRKYLYTVSEIMVCKSLHETKKKPYINFQAALCRMAENTNGRSCMNDEVINVCQELWLANRMNSKEKGSDKIAAVEILNQWIEEQLSVLVEEMKEKEDMLKTSFLACK